jgi:hypothetical protein
MGLSLWKHSNATGTWYFVCTCPGNTGAGILLLYQVGDCTGRYTLARRRPR